jgi:sugar O-acyltransferase (sialic acid O-acetyltransferase NeuD family)
VSERAPPAKRKLVIVGDSAFAEVACEYFAHDTAYDVVAFAVEPEFLQQTTLMGRPVVALDTVQARFPPDDHDVYVAIVYSQLNRLRTRLMEAVEAMGYCLASYVSSKAFVFPNVKLGKHCFIFENNVVQPFVSIGDNVVLWSGNHIGHHSTIRNNVFVSSHVVVSGFCDIGEYSFLGVNAAIGNNVIVAKDNWIGPGVVITQSTKENELYKSPDPVVAAVPARRFFKVRQ